MVDPITVIHAIGAVAQTAKAAWDVGEAIYAFIEQTKVVDQTAKALQSEVRSFSDACDTVRAFLEALSEDDRKRIESNDSEFLVKLRKAMGEYRRSVIDLGGSIADILEKKSNFLKQGWRTYKLNNKRQDISDLRSRIASHSSSVQMTLTILTLKVTLLTNDNLNPNSLRKMMTELSGKRATVQKNVHNRATDTIDADATLVEAADQALSSATTAYQGSIYRGSVADDESVFESPQSAAYVADWLKSVNDLNASGSPNASRTSTRDRPSPIPDAESGHSAGFEEPMSANMNFSEDYAQFNEPWSHEPPEDRVSVSSDENEVERIVIQNMLAVASEAFHESDYKLAKSRLEEALPLVQRIPSKHRSAMCDVWEIRYQLVVCSFWLKDTPGIEELLIDVLRQAPSTDDQRQNLYHLSHLLAHAHVSAGRLDQAETACKNALASRLKTLGKDHEDYLSSAALMHRICELQGKPGTGQGYLHLIPSSDRDRLVAQYSDLQPLKKPPAEPQPAKAKPTQQPPLNRKPVVPTSAAPPPAASSVPSPKQPYKDPPSARPGPAPRATSDGPLPAQAPESVPPFRSRYVPPSSKSQESVPKARNRKPPPQGTSRSKRSEPIILPPEATTVAAQASSSLLGIMSAQGEQLRPQLELIPHILPQSCGVTSPIGLPYNKFNHGNLFYRRTRISPGTRDRPAWPYYLDSTTGVLEWVVPGRVGESSAYNREADQNFRPSRAALRNGALVTPRKRIEYGEAKVDIKITGYIKPDIKEIVTSTTTFRREAPLFNNTIKKGEVVEVLERKVVAAWDGRQTEYSSRATGTFDLSEVEILPTRNGPLMDAKKRMHMDASARGVLVTKLGLEPTGELQTLIAGDELDKATELAKKSKTTDVTSPQGLTALHLAVLFGDEALVKLLLAQKGTDIHAGCFIDYNSPLAYVTRAYGDGKMRALHFAAAMQRTELMKILFAHGARSNAQFGRCLLPHYLLNLWWLETCNCIDFDAFKVLKSTGFDLNETLPGVKHILVLALLLPYWSAAEYYWVMKHIMERLLADGVKPAVEYDHAFIPLRYACVMYMETEIMELILKADPRQAKIPAPDGTYPLYWVVVDCPHPDNVRLEMAKILLAAGAPIDTVDGLGNSAWSLMDEFEMGGNFDNQIRYRMLLENYAKAS